MNILNFIIYRHRVILIILFVGLLLGSKSVAWTTPLSPSPAEKPVDNNTTLIIGEAISKELQGGALHTYEVDLSENQFAFATLEQKGIDVLIEILAPNGEKVEQIDTPNGEYGLEHIRFISTSKGKYKLVIQSFDKNAPAGSYLLTLKEIRVPTQMDKNHVMAQRNLFIATDLYYTEIKENLLKAVELYSESAKLYNSVGDRMGEIFALNYLAVLNDDLGNKEKALEYFDQLIILNDKPGTKDALVQKCTTLHNLARLYKSIGEKHKALDTLLKALEIYKQLAELKQHENFMRGLITTTSVIGGVYDDLGNKQKALDYSEQALNFAKQSKDSTDKRQIYVNLNNIGKIYDDLGEKEKALNYYEQALTLVREFNDPRHGCSILNNMGTVYQSLGKNDKALEYFNQALSFSQTVGDKVKECITLNNIGKIYEISGDKKKALDSYNEALKQVRVVKDRTYESLTLHNIGLLYKSLNQELEALSYLQQSLQIRKEIGDNFRQVDSLYNIAEVLRGLDRPLEALKNFERSQPIIENLRIELIDPDLRSSYFSTMSKYFEGYIDLLMHLHKVNPSGNYDAQALNIAEQVRARNLMELVAESGVDIRTGVDPHLFEREKKLRQQINAKISVRLNLLKDEQEGSQTALLEKEIEDLENKYKEVQKEIRLKNPHYSTVLLPEPITAKDIQEKLLDPNSILLEYFTGTEKTYLWVVTNNNIKAFELAKRSKLEDMTRRFYDALTARSRFIYFEYKEKREKRIAQADQEMLALAPLLTETILGPVLNQLGTKRLLVIPDGPLHILPFSALPVLTKGGESKSENLSLKSYKPLIADHEIVLLPSASVLSVLRQEIGKRNKAPKAVAVFADPVFSKNDERLSLVKQKLSNSNPYNRLNDENAQRVIEFFYTKRSGGIKELPRLFYTREEAKAIAQYTGQNSKYLLDFDASYETLFNTSIEDFRILHFATHGIFNTDRPSYSGLVLSLLNQDGKEQVGLLTLSDIFNLKLCADLVVLSACQTGLGKEIKGEGMVGITRGFFYAGTERVISSLWSINDKSTAKLMANFYQKLFGSRKTRPAAALREAQILMWRDEKWSHPYYWAAFQLQGEYN